MSLLLSSWSLLSERGKKAPHSNGKTWKFELESVDKLLSIWIGLGRKVLISRTAVLSGCAVWAKLRECSYILLVCCKHVKEKKWNMSSIGYRDLIGFWLTRCCLALILELLSNTLPHHHHWQTAVHCILRCPWSFKKKSVITNSLPSQNCLSGNIKRSFLRGR